VPKNTGNMIGLEKVSILLPSAINIERRATVGFLVTLRGDYPCNCGNRVLLGLAASENICKTAGNWRGRK
jgi:hypothetical protein